MVKKTLKTSRRKTQGEETRATLIQTGARLFAQHGYSAVSMRTLATEAGVNLATVSYHFGGKAGLYQAILQEIINIRDSIVPPSREVLARMATAGENIKAKAGVVDWFIEALIRGILGRMDNVWATIIITRELAHPSDLYPKLEQEFFDPSFKALYTLVENSLPHGTDRDDIVISAHGIIAIVLKLLEAHNLITKRLGWESYDGHLDTMTAIIKKRMRGFLGLPMENA
ncbi:CerR family C-terminal domain-containing protein [Pseudodesulfovibrio sp. S3-i]|nr:CerR family C-terminal domain-containing protein [Pseudodesulfovibrio sp. S3-i]